jgi:predicted transglutaminase-like cysteine proteinase
MQFSKASTVILALTIWLAGSVAAAAGSKSAMRLSGPTAPPIGHVEFCAEHHGECDAHDKPNKIVFLTSQTWARLDAVNRAVNTSILPATDMEIFGTMEKWAYPAFVGDCEDYVLQKRRDLIAAGWPASALLITVVRDEVGDGHAVLTVRTDRGDLVLDNKTDEIVVWDMAPYQFVKRQSTRHAANWDALEDHRMAAVGSLR